MTRASRAAGAFASFRPHHTPSPTPTYEDFSTAAQFGAPHRRKRGCSQHAAAPEDGHLPVAEREVLHAMTCSMPDKDTQAQRLWERQDVLRGTGWICSFEAGAGSRKGKQTQHLSSIGFKATGWEEGSENVRSPDRAGHEDLAQRSQSETCGQDVRTGLKSQENQHRGLEVEAQQNVVAPSHGFASWPRTPLDPSSSFMTAALCGRWGPGWASEASEFSESDSEGKGALPSSAASKVAAGGREVRRVLVRMHPELTDHTWS